ncbi:Gfo/Idh/MocA family oxidoreductase [Flammeovirgaceae bacterium SG7u.111]|nr:Gfo/Idh/MocA family oxidoreductase [Flammeovirgaceae bacterium SG7u.132]WPO37359.1 Gfo/Idh/MocA family oxidoreductase [Flammeovirgaceae bacterium SG7u.111]
MKNNLTRRNFVKKTAAAGLVASLGTPNILFGKDDRKVRLAFIGTGMRGRNHVSLAAIRDDVTITAICDIDPESVEKAKEIIKKAGKKEPAVYGKDEWDFKNMLNRDDIDGVIIATPWLWHTKMAVATMKAGKYAGVEVSAANTLAECWDLVNTYEETGMPCMILENVCYRPDVMAVLNMVRKGMFGELIHAECGYQHDLRGVKFNDGKSAYGKGVEFGKKGYSEAKWRTLHSVNRNGDIYPTHGIGPVAEYLNINRGNRFVSLTSTASKARGLHNYIVENGGEDHPNAKVNFKLGDVITTVIKTANEESIIVSHDTNLPRPYALGFRVQGTKGIWMDVNKSLHLEGVSPAHNWESTDKYFEEYQHPLWKNHASKAEGAGHGGMDWFVVHAFVESIKRKAPTPMDAYDAAAWSAITPLSEMSIADGSDSVDFPDFTRGQWMTNKPIFALDGEY